MKNTITVPEAVNILRLRYPGLQLPGDTKIPNTLLTRMQYVATLRRRMEGSMQGNVIEYIARYNRVSIKKQYGDVLVETGRTREAVAQVEWLADHGYVLEAQCLTYGATRDEPVEPVPKM